MVAQRIYAFRPSLPAVIGNEGVGRVLAVGPGVESVGLAEIVNPNDPTQKIKNEL